LIVDDEVEMRIAMSETLKHCGYPVEISHNAIDALKKFKQNEYSLVITDMTMPKRS
jgi:CheY-like chemotaxis protein